MSYSQVNQYQQHNFLPPFQEISTQNRPPKENNKIIK